MAKRRKKSRKGRRKGGGSQRVKFRRVAKSCQAKVRGMGLPAFSPKSWSEYGKCMKSGL